MSIHLFNFIFQYTKVNSNWNNFANKCLFQVIHQHIVSYRTDDVTIIKLTSCSSFSVDSLAVVGKYLGVNLTVIFPPLLGAGRSQSKQHQWLTEILHSSFVYE